jgi:ATP-dependent Clp protease ATP-binding subunit ClpA
MYEQFTNEARRIIFQGVLEAGKRGGPDVTAEHLLIAAIDVHRKLFHSLLRQNDCSTDSLRDEINKIIPAVGPALGKSFELSFALTAQKVIELAKEEMRRTKSRKLAPLHILAGILGAGGPGATILCMHGVNLESVRNTFQQMHI